MYRSNVIKCKKLSVTTPLPEAVPPVCVTVNDTLLAIDPLTMTTHVLPGVPSIAE